MWLYYRSVACCHRKKAILKGGHRDPPLRLDKTELWLPRFCHTERSECISVVRRKIIKKYQNTINKKNHLDDKKTREGFGRDVRYYGKVVKHIRRRITTI